eukprot:5799497-Amphidinium_carterae.2
MAFKGNEVLVPPEPDCGVLTSTSTLFGGVIFIVCFHVHSNKPTTLSNRGHIYLLPRVGRVDCTTSTKAKPTSKFSVDCG